MLYTWVDEDEYWSIIKKNYLLFIHVVVLMSSIYPKAHVHVPFKQLPFEKVQSAEILQVFPNSSEGVTVNTKCKNAYKWLFLFAFRKVRNEAKIRNRENQVFHLTQDTT